MFRHWLDLIEARIADARARGLFATTKKGPINDDFASLPAEARIEARIAASVGGAPPEVERMRDVKRLREELAKTTDPALREAITRRLRNAEIERNVLLERTGRAILVNEKPPEE
jgi:hypothetical protein